MPGSVHRAPGETLVFQTRGVGQPNDVTLRPFHALPYQRYNVYWTVLEEADGG